MNNNRKIIIKKLFNRNFTRDFGMGYYKTLAEDEVKDAKFMNDELNKQFNIKCFYVLDEEWVNFVISNRFEEGYEHLIDIVFGPKTTDKTYNYLIKYHNEMLEKEELLELLSQEQNLTYQYGYCSDSAVNLIQDIANDLFEKEEFFISKIGKKDWVTLTKPVLDGELRFELEEERFARRNIAEINAIKLIISTVEALARKTNNKQRDIVRILGVEFFKEQFSYICINQFLDIDDIVDELIKEYEIPEGNFVYENEFEHLPSVDLVSDYMARIVDGINETQKNEDYKLIFIMYASPIFNIIFNYDNHLYYLCNKYIVTCFKEKKILYNGEKTLKYNKS